MVPAAVELDQDARDRVGVIRATQPVGLVADVALGSGIGQAGGPGEGEVAGFELTGGSDVAGPSVVEEPVHQGDPGTAGPRQLGGDGVQLPCRDQPHGQGVVDGPLGPAGWHHAGEVDHCSCRAGDRD